MATIKTTANDGSRATSAPGGEVVSRPVQLPVTKLDDSAFAVAWAPTQHTLAHAYGPVRVAPPLESQDDDCRGCVSEPVN